MSKPFIHLHNHTEYSLLDGAASITRLVAKAKKTGAPAVAITDHGNMYGAIKFYEECKKQNIKPILGIEMYVVEDMHQRLSVKEERFYHLLLLAKNDVGFKNLSKLSSLAFLEGFYYKPRIDLKTLEKYTDGVICLSGCLAAAIPRFLLANDFDSAKNYALRLKNMFAEGDFYIEIQDHKFDEEKIVNPQLVRLAKELNVKLAATNDIHYIERSDHEMHDVLLCIQTGAFFDDANRMRFQGDEFYYKDYNQMHEGLGWVEEALETPYEIAEKCNVDFVFNEYQLPVYSDTDGLKPDDYLRKITFDGLKKRYGKITDEIKNRAEEELQVIISMGFAEYYLIVWDFITYAKKLDIPVGAGRGSGVGSIVAYAIGITNVEPLRFGLLFERFLHKDRTSMPDFDIDFCYNRRGEVIDYVKNKYGSDYISQIITFGTMKKRAAIKDVARVFRLPFADVTKLTKNITLELANNKKLTIKDLIDPNNEKRAAVAELIELYNADAEYKRVLDIAIQIENMPRHAGIHPAGVVIYKHKAIDTTPLAKNGDETTTQFDMSEIERLGLLKMDFLALMTLTDVKAAHDYVLKRTGRDINFDEIGYDDPEVYKFISSGNTDCVFQLESPGMRRLMMQFQPKNLEGIIAGIALYRPGPMDNIPAFIENSKNPNKVTYKHPLLKPILENTFGIIVYQEQAMTITRVLAGYSAVRADKYRSFISKKKEELMPKETAEFVEGCENNGVSREIAMDVWNEMASFAQYAFNKSHAAAYAVLAYETAFFKHYYTVEFMTAVLNNRIHKPDDTKKYMPLLKELKIPLLEPQINKSEALFSSTDGVNIRYGLACIKNVGRAAMELILQERGKGEFKDLYDFIYRTHGTSINKRMIESLIKGGAFDCFNMNRATLLKNYERVVAAVENKKKREESNQFDMFAMFGEEDDKPFDYQFETETPLRQKLLEEKEMLGMYLTGHPLKGYEEDFAFFNFNTSMLPKKQEEDEEDAVAEMQEPSLLRDNMDVYTGGLLAEVAFKRTKDGKEFAVLTLEDMHDKIEVICFSRSLAVNKNFLIKDALVKIKGRLTLRDEQIKITANEIIPWELDEREMAEQTPENLILYIKITNENKLGLPKINEILLAHKGACKVVFFNAENKQYVDTDFKIKNPEAVKKELAGLVGVANLAVREAKD
jgi:DNA polymerase-3 subunit alpha